jgi:hypothetical protein
MKKKWDEKCWPNKPWAMLRMFLQIFFRRHHGSVSEIALKVAEKMP